MLKLNFQNIFDDQPTQLNMTKQLETQAGSLTGRQSFFGQKLTLPKNTIFIQDQNDAGPEETYLYIKQSDNYSQFQVKPYESLKYPGQRIYYRDRANQINKTLQWQKRRFEYDQKNVAECYFKPVINKHSKAIMENKERKERLNRTENNLFTPVLTVNELIIKSGRQKQHLNKKIQTFMPTKQTKQMKQLSQCTFAPKLVTKSAKNFKLGESNFRSNPTRVHEKLYDLQKSRQYRKKAQQAERRQNQSEKYKKLSKNSLQDFFERNSKFIEKKQKKKEMLDLYRNKYNMETGKKYFEPALNDSKNQKYSKKWQQQTVSYENYENNWKTNAQVNPYSEIQSKRKVKLKKIQQVRGQLQNQVHFEDW